MPTEIVNRRSKNPCSSYKENSTRERKGKSGTHLALSRLKVDENTRFGDLRWLRHDGISRIDCNA